MCSSSSGIANGGDEAPKVPPRTDSTAKSPRPTSPWPSWLLVLLGLVFTVASSAYYYAPRPWDGIQDELAHLTWLSMLYVIVWGVLKRITPSGKRCSGFWFYAILFCAWTSYSSLQRMVVGYSQRSSLQRSAGELKGAMDALLEGEPVQRARSKEPWEFRVTQNFVHRIGEDSADVDRIESELNLSQMLSVNTLRDVAAIGSAVALLQSYGEAKQMLLALLERRWRELRSTVESLQVPESEKDGFLDRLGTSAPYIPVLRTLYQDFIRETVGLLEFVAERHATIVFIDEACVFSTEEDLAQYNLRREKMNKCLARIEECRAKIFAEGEGYLAALQHIAAEPASPPPTPDTAR